MHAAVKQLATRNVVEIITYPKIRNYTVSTTVCWVPSPDKQCEQLHVGKYVAVCAGLLGSSPDVFGKRDVVLPAKAREYVLPALVCVSVCVSVTTITKKCGRIRTKCYRKVPRGKRKTKFVFRYDRKRDVEVMVKKLRKPAIVYILYF